MPGFEDEGLGAGVPAVQLEKLLGHEEVCEVAHVGSPFCAASFRVAHQEHRAAHVHAIPTCDAEFAWTTVHAAVSASAMPASPAQLVVDRDALHERADDPRVADRAAAAVVHVTVQDGQVRELADLERARLRIEVVDVRGCRS